MRTACPHCSKKFDVSIKTILGWIAKSEKLQIATGSLLGRINVAKRGPIDPKSMSRGIAVAKRAANKRWEGHVKTVKPKKKKG